MKKADKFILTTICLSIITGVSSSFIDKQFPQFSKYSFYLLGSGMLFWVIYRIIEELISTFLRGRYAVLVYFLNSKNQLLLIKHPFHNCLLPVGGRLKKWELPHLAVKRTLLEEAGINDFIFHPRFHAPHSTISENVDVVSAPFSVHLEDRAQRGMVKFHYDFIYICKFKASDENIDFHNVHQPCWKDIQELKNLPRDIRPFDDVIITYEYIITNLQTA